MFQSTRVFRIFVLFVLLQSSIFAPIQVRAAVSSAWYSNTGFLENTLPRNDDQSTGLVDIGFEVNFFDTRHTQLYVNNNGNVTFDAAQYTYTPYDLTSTNKKIIAAFFADVDTRGWDSGVVTYGQSMINGRRAFGVNYRDVGYFNANTDKLNTFQLVLIEYGKDSGNFDIVFNYEKIEWETGSASGGYNGFGGASARAGYSNGTGDFETFYELPGSGVNGAFLDGAVSGLTNNHNDNFGVRGRYVYSVRNGTAVVERNPLVFVPGILGSQFKGDIFDDASLSWQSTDRWPTILSSGYEYLKLNDRGNAPFSTDREYTSIALNGILLRFMQSVDVYDTLRRYFTENMVDIGYQNYTEGQDFLLCAYDWRRPIETSARNELSACIARMQAANPGKKIDILAHSMGGLVAQRYVLMDDAANSNKIGHLVTIGTPYFGSPKALQQLFNGVPVPDEHCGTNLFCGAILGQSQSAILAKNLPSVYELLPSEYYTRLITECESLSCLRPYLTFPDKEMYSYTEGMSQLGLYKNAFLVEQARLSQTKNDSAGKVLNWYESGTHGVDVVAIVGSGYDTATQIKVERRIFNPDDPVWQRFYYTFASAVYGDGDGTVPTMSAAMRGRISDFGGGVTLAYCFYQNRNLAGDGCKHMNMAKEPAVLKFAARIFNGSLSSQLIRYQQEHNIQLAPSNDPTVPCIHKADGVTMPCGVPTSRTPRVDEEFLSLVPGEMNGDLFEFRGGMKVTVTDQYGNTIETFSDGTYSVAIPRASIQSGAGYFTIFVPNDRTYTFTVDGTAVSEASLRVVKYTNSEPIKSELYDAVPLSADSVAVLNYDTNESNTIALDANGDGSVDQRVGVAHAVAGEAAADTVAPDVDFTLTGPSDGFEWYRGSMTLSISATDALSGVDTITYSTDGGVSQVVYDSPVVLNPANVRQVLVTVTDRNGNVRTKQRMAPKKYRSKAALDGVLTEKSRTSSTGGSATAGVQLISIGDTAAREQTKGILSFDTAGIPDTAIITKATLRFKKAGVLGNPTALGAIIVDVMNGNFGNNPRLQPGDFQAVATKDRFFKIPQQTQSGWYRSSFVDERREYINVTGNTQFRLRLAVADTRNQKADQLQIYSGAAARDLQPQLLIEYVLP